MSWKDDKNRWNELYTRAVTPFDEMRVSQRTPIIQINGSYETSELRDVIKTDGTAEVTSVNSEFRLETKATGDKALMASASRGRYVPGYAAEAGIGARLPETPTGDGVARWGYFDTVPSTQDINDGAFFGVDTGGIFVAIYRNGTREMKTYREDWNLQPNYDIDPAAGNIYQIQFVYYGYGPVWFRIIDNQTERVVAVHKHLSHGRPTFSNSNLQVSGQAWTDSTGDPFDLFLSGRQFAVLGTPVFKERVVSHLREEVTVGTAGYTPIMSFRRKEGRRAVPIAAHLFECMTNNDIAVQWRVGSTITRETNGADLDWITPSDHDEDETAIEVNENADTIDMETGIKVDEDLVAGGAGPRPREFAEDATVSDIPDEYIVTLCAKALDTEATIDIIGKMVEER